MRLHIDSNELLTGLLMVNRAVAKNPTMPILETVFIQVYEDRLYLRTSNSSVSMEYCRELDSMENEDGEVCLDMKSLLSFVGTLPTQPITLTEKGKSVLIKHSSGKVDLPFENAIDFPGFPLVDSEVNYVDYDLLTFANRCRSLLKSISKDDALRPHMAAVCFDGANMVTTSGHALQMYTNDSPAPIKTMVPRTGIETLVAALTNVLTGGKEKTVRVVFDAKNTAYLSGPLRIVIKNVDGQYPDYINAIPDKQAYWLYFSRDEFITKLNRVTTLAVGTPIVRLDIRAGRLYLSFSETAFERTAEEEVEASTNLPEGFAIGFTWAIMKEFLSGCPEDQIKMGVTQDNRAVTLDAANYKGLLMPAMLYQPAVNQAVNK